MAAQEPLLRRGRRGRGARGRIARGRRRLAARRGGGGGRIDVLIRRAEPGDAGALVALGSAVGREPEGWLITSDGWRGVTDERRYLRALKRFPHAAVFVGEADGRIVARLSVARDQHPASHHVADLGLLVAAEYRRQGVGRALLEAAVDWARETRIRKLELHVFPHNDPAIRLYEQFGFQREGYRRAHYRRAGEYVDAILMAYLVDENPQ